MPLFLIAYAYTKAQGAEACTRGQSVSPGEVCSYDFEVCQRRGKERKNPEVFGSRVKNGIDLCTRSTWDMRLMPLWTIFRSKSVGSAVDLTSRQRF